MHLIWDTQCFPPVVGEQQQEQLPRNNSDVIRNINEINNNNLQRGAPPPEPIAARRRTPPPEPIVARRTPPPEPIIQRRRTPQPDNNLLFFTSIQDDMSVHSDDNYSTISDHLIRRFNIPDFVLGADENEPPRPDGRQRRIIDYVETSIEPVNRPSLWTKVKNIFLGIFALAYYLINHLFTHVPNWCIIYLFVLAILLCHGDQCIAHLNYFFSDPKMIHQLITKKN
jgi:hypothetical protein